MRIKLFSTLLLLMSFLISGAQIPATGFGINDLDASMRITADQKAKVKDMLSKVGGAGQLVDGRMLVTNEQWSNILETISNLEAEMNSSGNEGSAMKIQLRIDYLNENYVSVSNYVRDFLSLDEYVH